MPITKADLAIRAAEKLGLLMPGEALSAEDAAKIEQKVQAVHDSLGARGLLRWTIDDIPAYAEEPYAIMTAALSASDFGIPANAAPTFDNGEFELMRTISVPSSGDRVPFEAF